MFYKLMLFPDLTSSDLATVLSRRPLDLEDGKTNVLDAFSVRGSRDATKYDGPLVLAIKDQLSGFVQFIFARHLSAAKSFD